MIKFEKVTNYDNVIIPTRATKESVGYDFHIIKDIEIMPNERIIIPTGIKCKMMQYNILEIHIRSSIAIKKGLMLQNNVGIIDSDYYNNNDNEGHIYIPIWNTSDKIVKLKKGERFVQGIFKDYYITEDDDTSKTRDGGFGSTN